jgi:hypothetical protein
VWHVNFEGCATDNFVDKITNRIYLKRVCDGVHFHICIVVISATKVTEHRGIVG